METVNDNPYNRFLQYIVFSVMRWMLIYIIVIAKPVALAGTNMYGFVRVLLRVVR